MHVLKYEIAYHFFFVKCLIEFLFVITKRQYNKIQYERKLFLKQTLFMPFIRFTLLTFKNETYQEKQHFYLSIRHKQSRIVKCCGRLHLILGVACLIYKCRLFKQGQNLLVCSEKRKILIQKIIFETVLPQSKTLIYNHAYRNIHPSMHLLR